MAKTGDTMNWCRRHLNWTWIIVALPGFATVLFDSPIPYVVWGVLFFAVSFLVLAEKGRSWAWIYLPVAIPLLPNRKTQHGST